MAAGDGWDSGAHHCDFYRAKTGWAFHPSLTAVMQSEACGRAGDLSAALVWCLIHEAEPQALAHHGCTVTASQSERRKGLTPPAVPLPLSWAQPGPSLTPDLCKALLCALQRLGQLQRLLCTSTGWQLSTKTWLRGKWWVGEGFKRKTIPLPLSVFLK